MPSAVSKYSRPWTASAGRDTAPSTGLEIVALVEAILAQAQAPCSAAEQAHRVGQATSSDTVGVRARRHVREVESTFANWFVASLARLAGAAQERSGRSAITVDVGADAAAERLKTRDARRLTDARALAVVKLAYRGG